MKYALLEVQEAAKARGIEYDRARKITETYGHEVVEETRRPWNGGCGGEVNAGTCVVCGSEVKACWIKPIGERIEHCTRVQCIITATLQGGGYDPASESPADGPTYCVTHIPRV